MLGEAEREEKQRVLLEERNDELEKLREAPNLSPNPNPNPITL